MKKTVVVNDGWQSNYTYELTEPMGNNFDNEFKPDLTPKQMLAMGVFSGIYYDSIPNELPADWFENAKISRDGLPDDNLNFYQIKASQPLLVWQQKGWIDERDPRGWFQWYCRYFIGRRIPAEDRRQIKRWKAMRRHIGQITKNCQKGDLSCRRKQRQALLHWAYDSTKY